MKKALVFVALLGLVASANAGYRMFFTTTDGVGLTNPGLIGNPSQAITSNDQVPIYSDNLDVYGGHYAVQNFPAYDPAQNCQNPLVINQGEWVYIWGQFIDEAAGARLFSANVNIVDCVTGDLGAGLYPVWYKVDDLGNPGGGLKRWDGASTEADNYATFRNVAQSLQAVTANGLKNIGGAAATETWNLYTGGANGVGRIHLLGAVRGDALGTYTFQIPADLNGDPLFVISGVPVWPVAGAFQVVPEPASMLLLGLAGLLIRRR